MRTRPLVHAMNESNGKGANISISNEQGQEVEIAHGVPWPIAHPLRGALEAVLTVAIESQDEAYVRPPQAEWPAHLRDDAPQWRCTDCLRVSVGVSDGDLCDMPQPNGSRCRGTFQPIQEQPCRSTA